MLRWLLLPVLVRLRLWRSDSSWRPLLSLLLMLLLPAVRPSPLPPTLLLPLLFLAVWPGPNPTCCCLYVSSRQSDQPRCCSHFSSREPDPSSPSCGCLAFPSPQPGLTHSPAAHGSPPGGLYDRLYIYINITYIYIIYISSGSAPFKSIFKEVI